MTSTKTTPLFIGQRLSKGLAICALSMTGSLAFAAQTDRAEMELAANTGPLSEFYLPTTAKPAPTKIAGDKKTESEDAGTRKGRAKLVADAGAVHGGSGGKGKNKKAADENNANAETDAGAAPSEAAPAESPAEAAPTDKAPTTTEAAPTAEAAPADNTSSAAEAAPAEAASTDKPPVKVAAASAKAAAETAPAEKSAVAAEAPTEEAAPAPEAPPAKQEAPTAEAASGEQTAPDSATASTDAKANAKIASSTKAKAKDAATEPAQVAENSKPETAVAEPAAPDVEASSKEKAAQSKTAVEEQAAAPAEAVAATVAAPAATAPAADDSAAPADQAAAANDASTQAAAPGDCGAKPAQEAANNTASEEPPPVDTEVHWTYEGDTGPEHWAELSPKFKACSAGKRQTPIDIESSAIVPVGLEDVQFNYGRVRAKAINNGHTIQFNVDEGNSIRLDGVIYNLTQIHFHTPSEHTIDGGSYPMEMHLVHKDAKGNYAVVAILMEKGAKNPVLNQLWAKLPKSESNAIEVKDPVDLHALLPTDTSSYRYTGSLTTPPCTEGVKWIVLRSTAAVTMKQFAAFKKIFPMNARPLQPINARSVLEDVTSANAQASN